MIWPDAFLGACLEEDFEAFVSEGLDHSCSVAQHYTNCKSCGKSLALPNLPPGVPRGLNRRHPSLP
jgi:hypothetical protein